VTDQLEELLADLRESAVREIRPPGAAAARRTVRRRRATGAVAGACALSVALFGGFSLAQRPPTTPVLPAATPSPSRSESFEPVPDQRLARQALERIRDDRPAFEIAGPVQSTDIDQRMYLPHLTLTVVCAGAGKFTLVVTGDVAGDKFDKNPDRELLRVKVPCGADPTPITREINASMAPELRFGLEDTKTAYQKAGFAIRVTGDGEAPLSPDDSSASVQDALMRNVPTRAGGVAPEDEPFDGEFRLSGRHAEFPAGERYTFALACRGSGTYSVQIRRGGGGPVLAEHSAACSWPPVVEELDLPEPLGKDVEFWTRYRAEPGQRAETGWALHIR
jgi:hypothetical protein